MAEASQQDLWDLQQGPQPDELTDFINKSKNNTQADCDNDCRDENDDENKDDPPRDSEDEEEQQKLREEGLTDEQRENLKFEALSLKASANDLYKSGKHQEAISAYTDALDKCPLVYTKERSIFYSNRAAAKIGLGLSEGALEDCHSAISLNPSYIRALERRGKLFEDSNKPHEAMKDFEEIIKLDPGHREANLAVRRLPDKIKARDEEIKTEMFGNLKKLGNMVLNPFGMSTDNFQFVQDPNTGGYSVNYKS